MKKMLISLFCLLTITLSSQEIVKKNLDHSVYDSWKNISNTRISDNGEWVSCEINPQLGDGYLHLYNTITGFHDSVARGYAARFTPGSRHLLFLIKPGYDTIRQCKLKKMKAEKMPKDSLGIWLLDDDSLILEERIKSFKLADKNSDWIIFQHEKAQKVKDTTASDSTNKAKNNKKRKNKYTDVTVFNPENFEKFRFSNVSDFSISENGLGIGIITTINDSVDSVRVSYINTLASKAEKLFERDGYAKSLALGKEGGQLSFIISSDTGEIKVYDLMYWRNGYKMPSAIVDTTSSEIPDNWSVSEYGALNFSDDGKKLYFGTAPIPEQKPKDTLTKDEKVSVDIWNWQDPLLQPQQLKMLEKEKKRNYLAMYDLKKDQMLQLGNETIRKVYPRMKGPGKFAFGKADKPYLKRTSWKSSLCNDIYLIDLADGSSELILERKQSSLILSPAEKYVLWYEVNDSAWHVFDTKKGISRCLTCDIGENFYNEEFDMPFEPYPYGVAGWSEDDKYVLIHDRFDIWKLDPAGKETPERLTAGYGRKNNTRFRIVITDRDKEYIDLKETLLLSAFNEDNKQSGYYQIPSGGKTPEKLIMGDYRFTDIKKSRKANKLIWKKENFHTFPDLWSSDLELEQTKRLTFANPQQSKYLWGDVELINWKAYDGTELEGLLYKPEGFDPEKKYPVICYFYETYSDRKNAHIGVKPSRSVINFTYYTSNGYVIFVPDIKYKDGYPGKSAYNAIVSGTEHLLQFPWVDKDKLGLQGQSWGGYQVAYLVTQTNMYAAAMAGAPVSNMTSAYGGIRWGSGKSRMFQYEESQSRIGGTLWEKPQLYIENSPLFMAPDINTPLLIMHNDKDGAVPWYQGIELFVALRRLNKPAWMLTYNGAPHNLSRRADMKDLTIRMQQFFDHYLKDKPAPKWMTEGVPAIKKGIEFGFELED